jgi:argininosuccinate synthase
MDSFGKKSYNFRIGPIIMKNEKIKKVVLAYSGGLDTSVILTWLKETYQCDVIAFAADIGQKEELHGLNEKALATGAVKCVIRDLRREFVTQYVFRAIRAGAIYEKRYLLGTSLARPLIAKAQVEIARSEGANAVSHGATGKGNDQVRFELTYMALAPDLIIIAPWREWNLNSRTSLLEYAKARKIPVPVTAEKPYSMDRNIMHLSFEGGILEDPFREPDSDMFRLTVDPQQAPDKPEYLELEFRKGYPMALNGQEMDALELMEKLNDLGGKHGIGRVDIVENRLVGIKSRGVYETPGGTILHAAHRDLESITLDRGVQHYKDRMSLEYAELIYNGLWFSPQMEALEAYVAESQKYVSGVVRLRLYKGNVILCGRKSQYSLYQTALATFEADTLYDQKDAKGFINLFGLPIKMDGLRKQQK